MKKILYFMAVIAVLTYCISLNGLAYTSDSKWNIPSLPVEVIEWDKNGSVNAKLIITDISVGQKTNNDRYKITISGYITECREGINTYITLLVTDATGQGVDIGRKYVNNPKRGDFFTVSHTTISLPYGTYMLEITNGKSIAAPSPTPTPDLSKYLGNWYANAIYNTATDSLYSADMFSGTTIIVNKNHSIKISIPGFGTSTGNWDIKNDSFYIDGEFSDLYFLSSGDLWFDLGDSYYLVMTHNPPLKPTASPSPTEIPILKGDVNGDGTVDGRDVLRLARYMAGDGVSVDMAAADMNGDGNVDGRDVLRLAKQLAGN